MEQLLAAPPKGHTAPWAIHGRRWVFRGRHSSGSIFTGSWDAKDWRNVPGPFYAGATDTCGGGRVLAPSLILVNEDWTEFVFRQPSDSTQVLQLIDTAWDDPFGEYACDGDDHWTLQEIRRWWADRGRLLEWIESAAQLMANENATNELASLRQYAADIHGPLEDQLRHYAYWLDNREPASSELELPQL